MNYDYNPGSGLIDGAHYCPSPNCDDRPDGLGPEVLVIHSISLPPGEFGGPGINQLFTNTLDPDEHPYYQDISRLEVSAHLLVRRDGEVVQYVPLLRRAWHAGVSEIESRSRVNDFSIGIELEGGDDVPFEAIQYDVLEQLCRLIMKQFPEIRPDRIYGHCHIAPGRKTDPGPLFDWALFRSRLAENR